MRGGAARRLALAALAALPGGCRFGGPSASPTQAVDLADSTAPDASADATTGSDATLPDAGEPGGDGPGDGGEGDAPQGTPLADDASCAATVAVCDPVHDTGCNPLQQCDVGAGSASTPTGNCVFHAAPADAGCAASIVSETCDAGSTCVANTCRALCHCDGDCPTGQCCTDTSGPAGFVTCAPCQ